MTELEGSKTRVNRDLGGVESSERKGWIFPRRHLNRILDVFAAGRTTQAFTMLALSRRLWGLQRRLAAAKDEFLVSKVVQLRAAIAPRGFALPQHLNLMSSDAGNRAGSAGLAIILALPNDAVA